MSAGSRAVAAKSKSEGFRRPAAPWANATGLDAAVERWKQQGLYEDIVLDHRRPQRAGAYGAIPDTVGGAVRGALAKRGIERLYSHQADAIDQAQNGRHLVVSTPTASGKSLCFHVPVLTALEEDAEARAIYLFPTKALSRDQETGLRNLMKDAGLRHGAITYDGDTPGDARRAARERTGILLTNPDMLHSGILPHHTQWSRLFSNLRYVVVDELHMYRGVFGSHLANVIRRLRRIAEFHGSTPQFIFASATIGNPQEHAERMLGDSVELVGESGAPEGDKRVLIYNPPFVNRELGIRRSYIKTAVDLTADLLRSDVPTLLFGQSRNSVEVMLKYLRDRLTREGVDPNEIQGYRGGYLPDTRRRIERGLRAGTIRCVVATNALELGIDIGSLQAVVCAGYPGNVAALWQRFGRGGRQKEGSLSLLVTSSAPLDQYVASDPNYIVAAAIEHARIDPDNVEIFLQHLKCAAFELPFVEGDRFGSVPVETVVDALSYLADKEVLFPGPSADGRTAYHWATDHYPANGVSLRSVSWDNFVVIDLDTDKTIAEMDWRSTHTMLHVQAIYQHDAGQFQVEELDFENHKAYVRQVKPDYYTTAMTHTKVLVLEEDEREELALGRFSVGVSRGDVSVIEKVVGYKKIKYHTHENVGYGDVHLPEMQMHTTGMWLTFPEALVTSFPHPRAVVVDALRGVGQALHTVGAIGLMVDPRDIGRTLRDRSEEDLAPGGASGFDPTLFLFDRIPGGIGLSPRLFEERTTLLLRARALVEGCSCEDGCVGCIGPVVGEALSSVSRKGLVLQVLDRIGIALH
ncbi:MAG: DEAD/DEAH box helicase [Myxococcota bacterium]